MEDNRIIELYFRRSEAAVRESRDKYGRQCGIIAYNILRSKEDSEECVNDTWFRAWNVIPPAKPNKLSAFFGRITRNLAIDRLRKLMTEKRGGGETAVCLDELAECVGCEDTITDDLILKDALERFLGELTPMAREIFMLRYWYMYDTEYITARMELSEGAVKMSLHRSRTALRIFLENEGFDI
ncbi:MAG: sigma-70 family RNA polymerase sigma factor [Bacteroides sp.]|nr:sigma-70 family RNA polymerase sigma factor [Bacteroides sp.]